MNDPKLHRFLGEPTDYVLASEYYALRDDWKSYFSTREGVHMAMLRGQIAKITMEQCAHLHGVEMMAKWNRFCDAERAREIDV